MHFSKLDAYFYLASFGNKEAFNLLYQGFIRRAETEVAKAGYGSTKYAEFSGDFYEFVDQLFFKIINTFEQEKGSFTYYCEYCIKTRLVNEMSKLIAIWNRDYSDTDLDVSEHVMTEPEVEDPTTVSIRQDIEFNKFRYAISSGNRNAPSDKRLKNKILLMLYAGYRAQEICTKLKLTKSQYRYLMEKIKKDEDVLNLQLEIK